MKAHYKTRSGRIIFEVEGPSTKAIFLQIAALQDVFEADTICGHCQSTNIKLRVRSTTDGDFYEFLCEDCTAALSFGQTKKNEGLYAKRKDADGNVLPCRGWKIWKGSAAAAAAEEHVPESTARR